MSRLSKLVVCVALSAGMSTALAAEPSPEQVTEAIGQMEQRLKSYRRRLKAVEAKVEGQGDSAQPAGEHSPAPLPDWAKDLKFSGDLRLRYEGRLNDSGSKDRHRARFRLRMGLKKYFMDKQMEVGVRVATGGGTTSTNQTFDNSFDGKSIFVDRAYAIYKPADRLKGLTLAGGKIKNPFVHTDMVWDSDLNPEGFWAAYKTKLGAVKPFVGGGYFVIEESSGGHDTTVAGYQAGFECSPADGVKWTAAATYYGYDFHDADAAIVGAENCCNFNLVNVTNKVKLKVAGTPVAAYIDWVHNLDNEDVRPQFEDKDTGYAAGVKVGKNKAGGDISASYKYAYIEANATPGVFNDSDFFGSNRKGHVAGVKYNLTDFLTVGGKVFHTSPITGNSHNRDTLVQFDLAWKF